MEMQTPADLLALIPVLISREPEEMLVLVTMKDGQLQSIMGLEHCPDVLDTADYVHSIVAQMIEVEPDAVVTVFYTDREPEEGGKDAYELTYMLIKLALIALTPIDVSPGILVSKGKYKLYGSDHWHDMSETKDSELAANMVLNGMPLDPLGVVIPEPSSVTDEVTAAIDDALANIPKYPSDIHAAWAMPLVVEARALYESLLQRGFGATEEEAIRLIAYLISPVTRDRLMVDTITSTLVVEDFAKTITGNGGASPNPDRLEAGMSLLDNLMQWTCDRHRLPLMVTQAWFKWQMGRALDAEQYLKAALELDPEYNLARAFQRYIKDLKRIPDGVLHDGRNH